MKQIKPNGIIAKFGGTSVGSPESIRQIIKIISSSKKPVSGIVVSAFSKVTNQLIETAELASKGDEAYLEILKQISNRHIEAINILVVDKKLQRKTIRQTQVILAELSSVLKGVYLIKELSAKILDLIMSYGERLSAYIISQSFKNNKIEAEYVDTRELIKTDNHFNFAHVNFKQTYKNISDYFRRSKKNLKIITGFIGSTENGETTTLGRGGSDYTASIFGAAINASIIEIWTDVNGVLTADPKKVKSAFTIPKMTYQEAMEMSHFGAKVIYPPTMIPACSKKIPLVIRNTFNPQFCGTLIGETTSNTFLIKGISSIENISVLLVQGSGMVGIPGIAMRIFGALAKNSISVILITQASSEHTVCFAVDPKFVHLAKAAIEDEFKQEIKDKIIDPLIIEEHLSIIAVVGEYMKISAGIAGKLFTALGKNNINVVAIAQGSSERNISIVVANKDEKKALCQIHKTFFGR